MSRSLAARIIEASGPDHPADACLREFFRSEKGLLPCDKAAISKTVFTYFRWKGWLDPQASLPEQIIQARQLAGAFEQDPGKFDPQELTSRAVPGWVSEEMEVTPDWARALQTEPRLWLRAKSGAAPALANRLGRARPAGPDFPDALLYLGGEDLFHDKDFREGQFEIQDLASQAVSIQCAPRPGEKWWDTCAGEGGKTLHLSELMQNRGLIWASDRSERRLARLKARAARARVFNVRLARWEGTQRLPTRTFFDGVLVDAPCSGIGTWQRNPHARWTTSSADVRELALIQQKLLCLAAQQVKPGGKLIYSVCTLTRAETMGVVGNFNRLMPGFVPLDESGFKECRTILPQQYGCNGMFIAGWRRDAGSGKAE